MQRQRIGPLCLFIALILVSHFLLPILGTKNLGPFTTWQLFTKTSTVPYYDVIIEIQNQRYFLTEVSARRLSQGSSKAVWSLAQDGEAHTQSSPLKKILNQEGAAPISFCKIKIKLADYMLLTPEGKKDSCEVIAEKI